jgi:DNA invertase Pin-like site-specific DNA recombinase
MDAYSTSSSPSNTWNQADAIHQYADRHGYEIVRTADEGRSGLRLEARDAIQRLIADVESGAADFSTIFVYDVSRWSRFQNADEGAYCDTDAAAPASRSATAPSSSRTTAARSRRSSRA